MSANPASIQTIVPEAQNNLPLTPGNLNTNLESILGGILADVDTIAPTISKQEGEGQSGYDRYALSDNLMNIKNPELRSAWNKFLQDNQLLYPYPTDRDIKGISSYKPMGTIDRTEREGDVTTHTLISQIGFPFATKVGFDGKVAETYYTWTDPQTGIQYALGLETTQQYRGATMKKPDELGPQGIDRQIRDALVNRSAYVVFYRLPK